MANGYKNRYRTLAPEGRVKTFATAEERDAHAQKLANRLGTWVGLEEWSPDHPQDELNQGWALTGTVKPVNTDTRRSSNDRRDPARP